MLNQTEKLPITDRVIAWNMQRYNQEFDYQLAVKLILEETEELYSAITVIDKLDAIGDIAFVAIGVFWKLGLTDEFIRAMLYNKDLRSLDVLAAHDWLILCESNSFDVLPHEQGAWPAFSLATNALFITALGALRGLNMQKYFYDVIHAIADSNDTKEIKGKVAANVKANISKGDSYVPPTARLQQIYDLHIKEFN